MIACPECNYAGTDDRFAEHWDDNHDGPIPNSICPNWEEDE